MRVLPSTAAAAALLVTCSGLLGADWSYDSKSDPSMGEKASGAAAQAGAAMTSQAPLGREVAGIEYAQLAAWNRHDLTGYLSFYWNSPELISLSNGDELVGYSAVASQFLGAFSKDPSSMGNPRLNRLRVKLLGPDTAVVVASYVVTTSKHVDSCEDTSLVRRFSEGWRIVFESTNIHSQ